jgi:molybdopterin adenylyltransferase
MEGASNLKWKVALLRSESSSVLESEGLAGIQVLREMIEEDLAGEIIEVRTVPSDMAELSAALYEMIDYFRVDLVFTLGGIGIGAHDVVPEATKRVMDREVPGMAEAMRNARIAKHPLTMLERGTVVLKDRALIINLPDDPSGILESLQAVMPVLYETLKLLRKD